MYAYCPRISSPWICVFSSPITGHASLTMLNRNCSLSKRMLVTCAHLSPERTHDDSNVNLRFAVMREKRCSVQVKLEMMRNGSMLIIARMYVVSHLASSSTFIFFRDLMVVVAVVYSVAVRLGSLL